MKILHTADWHLGASFGPERRIGEFDRALDWLAETIRKEKIEALLIAGDVFDTGVPPNSAVEQYYRFLLKARDAGVRKAIVTAGNHDSASFLDAPKALLEQLDIFVAGKADPEYDSLIIPLTEADGTPAAAVCAVPFLRDRDIRQAVSGETADEQLSRRTRGILEYYRNITRRAGELYPGLPVIAMGHFYAAGGKAGDTVVGTLSQVPIEQLPGGIAYLALGHLHTPQKVAGRENCRYSGSLLQMSFAEPGSGKSMPVLDTADLSAPQKMLAIPVFQRIEKISGTTDELKRRIGELAGAGESVWLHAENTGEFQPGLFQLLSGCCENSPVRIISCSSVRPNPAIQQRRLENPKPLEQLDPEEVFLGLLRKQPVSESRRESWLAAFREAVREVEEDDVNA